MEKMTLPFAILPDSREETTLQNFADNATFDVSATLVTDARGITPYRARGREEKWRVLATSRREKRGRAFLRKVGREGIRLYTSVRRGTLAGEASSTTPAGCRAAAAASLSEKRAHV